MPRILTFMCVAAMLVLMQAGLVSGKDPVDEAVSFDLKNSPPQYYPQQPSSDSPEINWEVLSGGGLRTTTTGFILSGTIGQLAVGNGSTVDIGMHHGYWQDFGPSFPCGDADESGGVDIDDVMFIINYIFGGGPAPDPIVGNVNCLEAVDIDDIMYLINYIFGGGPVPCADCPY
jgi:hypothetical protein